MSATVFPDDPTKRFVVHWEDQENASGIGQIEISGTASRWQTANGIKPGATLAEIEKINGGPFVLMGFEWDMGGMAEVDKVGLLSEAGAAEEKLPAYHKVLGVESSPRTTRTCAR